MSRICASCGAAVDRGNCHKNRYSEYICRKCQAEGVRFGPRGRRLQLLRWTIPVLAVLSVIVGLLALAAWLHLVTFDQYGLFGTQAPEMINRHSGTSLNPRALHPANATAAQPVSVSAVSEP